MTNLRYNISPCSAEETRAFISKIGKEYFLRSAVMADEKSHYDRYSYLREDSRVAVVYDTRAQVISITAPEAYAEELVGVFGADGKTVKSSTVPAQTSNKSAQNIKTVRTSGDQKSSCSGGFNKSISVDTENGTRAKLFVGGDLRKPNRAQSSEFQPKREPRASVATIDEKTSEKTMTPKRTFGEVSERAGGATVDAANGGYAAKTGGISIRVGASAKDRTAERSAVAAVRKPHATISFGDEDDDKRNSGTLARTGTGLYAELSAKSAAKRVAADNAEKSVAADATDKPKKTLKKQDANAPLKRWLPTAYDYLPEQARNDFANGIHDFYQAKLQPKDYSGTLMLPYRGLEGFVVGLQHAKNIKVKMIGQAFDKDESGNYILKRCYSQRINSVVFDEVMVALYGEYFKMRNFIVHTDNDDGGVSRSISDRAVAKGIFDNIIRVVEYNAKKLKEIGFEPVRE